MSETDRFFVGQRVLFRSRTLQVVTDSGLIEGVITQLHPENIFPIRLKVAKGAFADGSTIALAIPDEVTPLVRTPEQIEEYLNG